MGSDHLVPSGTWTRCSPHVPPTTCKIGESSRSSSCVQLSTWHLVVLMTPRNNITASSTNTFGSFDCILRRNLCVAILSDTISEREYCRHCATFQRDIFVPRRVDKSRHSHLPKVLQFPSSELRCSLCSGVCLAMHVTDSSGIV